MSERQAEQQISASAPPRAQFRFWQFACWLPLCLVHGTAIAWLAYGVQKHFAPLGLFPILVGLVLGATLAGLMRLVQVANTRTILVGAVLASTATIVGQHYFSYQEQWETAVRQAAQFRMAAEAHPDLVQGSPPKPASGLVEYLRWQALRGRPIVGDTVARGGMAWASWALDACLVIVTAFFVIVPASMQPYCNQCRTWFSTVRRGHLAAASAKEVGVALGMEASEGLQEGTYRIVHCQGGCGVAGFEISWELADGGGNAKQVWVSPEVRLQLEKMISPTPQAKA